LFSRTTSFCASHHLVGREGDLHAQDLGAVEQALGVLLQAEDGRAIDRVVGAHAFEGAAAVVQGVGQHVDLGVAPVDHLAVHPDLAVAVGSWILLRRIGLGHHRHAEAQFGGLLQPLLPARRGRTSPASPTSPKAMKPLGRPCRAGWR
jgi:hypothetical protein